MKLLTRCLAREVYANIALVFVALTMLFAFFDLIHELNILSNSSYHLGYVSLFVLLTMPIRMYELFPMAVLIGAIFALTQMAANSELTVYRSSGVSLRKMITTLLTLGLPLVLLGYLCGEVLAPISEQMIHKLRLKAQNTEISVGEFRSGVWAKDNKNFVNIKKILLDTTLLDISIYEFNEDHHLRTITAAKHAVYLGDNNWRLEDVEQTAFHSQGTTASRQASIKWHSALNVDILRALLMEPKQMSVLDLYSYIGHLRDNNQKTAPYEVVMWNKLMYPLTVLVMMLLALPFAAHQQRTSGISTKIFIGITLGLTFHFTNKLFASLGSLNAWQPLMTATVMPALFLLLATGMLWRTERR